METIRENLLAKVDLQWTVKFKLRGRLREINHCISRSSFYLKNPLELQRRYQDVYDYVRFELQHYYNEEELRFTNPTELFSFLKSERKVCHYQFKLIKITKKRLLDELSTIPKIKD